MRTSAFLILVLAASLAVPSARAADLYDKVLDEDHFEEMIGAEPVCVVVYHVGRDSERKQSLARLVSLLVTASERKVPFFRAEIGSFSPGARNLVIQNVGRNEFPALVLYLYGSPVERAFPPPESLRRREQDAWYDSAVERFRPRLVPPPAPDDTSTESAPDEEPPPEEPPSGEPSPPPPEPGPVEAPSEPAPVSSPLPAPAGSFPASSAP